MSLLSNPGGERWLMRDLDTNLDLSSEQTPTTRSEPTACDRMKSAGMCAPSAQAKRLHVAFSEERKERKRNKKYFTAKYGAHQMALVKKRLGVETWMFDQLQALYSTPENEDNEVDIDLDELLDMEDDVVRKEFLLKTLHGAKKSRETVEDFVEQLIILAKTL